MKRTFKAGLITVCMTALATAPIVTITTLATADAAYAKGGNGKGNGGGGGGGGNGGGNSSAGGKGHGQDKAASARSGGKDAKSKGKGKAYGQTRSASKGGPKTIGEFFQKLTGQDKKASRTTTSRSASAKKTVPTEITEAPAKRGGKRIAGMHASQLGNMNAAYNANISAVLAHIRNGNTNGPVGVVAGLAVAKIAAGDAQSAFDVENGYLALETALIDTPFAFGEDRDYATAEEALEAYLAATEDPTNEAVDTALTHLDDADEVTPALTGALASALSGAGYGDDLEAALQSYNDDILAAESAVDPEVEAALNGLIKEDGTTIARDEDADISDLEVALEDAGISVTNAEDTVIETWNKSDAANEEDTAALLDALHTRILDNEGAIKSTIAETTSDTEGGTMDGDGVDGDIADCEDGDLCGEGELEELASAD